MTTRNRLAETSAEPRVIPPQGDSSEQKAARVQFWLERGNFVLDQAGKHHLKWAHANGHYFIEPRGG